MEDFAALTPINFFQIVCDCYSVEAGFPKLTAKNFHKYLLPDLSNLCSEKPFAEIAMGWNQEGLEIYASVSQPCRKTHYPEVMRGDSLELCIDTRDVKTAGFNTRFCHHFFFLPEAFEGHIAGEVTRFRTEDTHPLCDPEELKVKSQVKKDSYIMQIFIPAHCLHGYDPEQFDRMGFTYRINRTGGPPQHFSVVTEDYQIEQQPSLWSSVRLWSHSRFEFSEDTGEVFE